MTHIHLPIDISEQGQAWTPKTSRLAHLTLINALAVGVVLLSPPLSEERLNRM